MPYSYSWNTGDTTSSIINLFSGNYSLVLSDGNGCQLTYSVFISEPSALLNSINSSNPTCNGFLNGSISNITSGSVPPYNYLWSTGDTSQHLINVGAGQYLSLIHI